MTRNVALPQKHINKKTKKGEQEILVISSQTTGATAPSVSLSPPIVEASMRELQNPPMDQATKVQPTFPAVIEPIIVPLVEGPTAPRPVVTFVVGLVTVAVGKEATLAERSVIVVEEEI